MISCNVNSNSRLVNSQEHMDCTVEVNGLAAVVGEMKADAYKERKERLAKVKETSLVSILKKQDAAAALANKKIAMAAELTVLAEGLKSGTILIKDVRNATLSDLLIFF